MATPRVRRDIRMDVVPQRAMMARFDEPTFCPTDMASLVPRYPILLPGSVESSSAPATIHAPSDHDGPEDDDGRVSLTESPNLDIPEESQAQFANATSASSIQRSANLTSSLLSILHPRPDTPDIWAEEDSRRLRLALDGDHVSDAPRFMQPEEIPSESTRRLPEYAAISRSVDSPGQMRNGLIRPRTPDHHVNDPSRPPRASATAEDDLLDVNDADMNYDVAEFVDAWRSRTATDRSLPSFRHDLPPTVGLWPASELVVRPTDVLSGLVDVQGICWADVGTTREDALDMRTSLHPARTQHVEAAKGGRKQCSSGDEAVYRFRSFAPKHRSHVCHYQLRNSLAAISRSDIFYANRSRVYSTSLASPSSQKLVMSLAKPHTSAINFRVTCLATSSTSSDLLFAGGFLGEYAMLRLDAEESNPPIEGFVTHAYNGLVTHIETSVGRSSGLPQATFCSNDQKVRTYDATTGRFTDCFRYAHAVNCSAVSTDSRLRILVGDSHDTCITTAERGDVVVTLPGHTDHAFATAGPWCGTPGIGVACAALDSPLSCPRSLHFADDNHLIVAAGEDVVSVYDAGTFAKRQEVRFFGSIAGVAMLDGGAEMAVANSDQAVGGLLAFERTGSRRREDQPSTRARPPARRCRGGVLDRVMV
ncbi:WD40 repeat protein [Teratosphaeria destructans]|uniref:WD40 repeat protein n=1 Tax=Teratosphaeria destructans TaxID=418781 RepID=A0A9W7SJD4_9PEZI|nr:WD40 repeat protein [Teratosphaeria destructans]